MTRYVVYTKEKGKIETDNWADFLGLTVHRLDGPAYQAFYDNGQLEYESYYINNKYYTTSAYDVYMFNKKMELI